MQPAGRAFREGWRGSLARTVKMSSLTHTPKNAENHIQSSPRERVAGPPRRRQTATEGSAADLAA